MADDPDLPSPAELSRARRRRDSWIMLIVTIGSAVVIAAVLLAVGAFRRSTG